MPKNNKQYRLNAEEKEILSAFKTGAIATLPEKEKKRIFDSMQKAAKDTLLKKHSITLRISETDLHKIKVKAQTKGMPYQTLINSILHEAMLKK